MKRFDSDITPDLFAVRYPDDDGTVTDVLRIAALSDPGRCVDSLAAALGCGEFTIDLIDPGGDVVQRFLKYPPDVLIISSDGLSEDYIYELTEELIRQSVSMPLLVNIRQIEKRWLLDTFRRYGGRYFIDLPCDIPAEAEKLYSFLMRSVLTEDYYSEKIKSTIGTTLDCLGCSHSEPGYEFIAEAAFIVLKYPYIKLDFDSDVYGAVARQYGLPAATVKNEISRISQEAFRKLSDRDKKLLLSVYPEGSDVRNELTPDEFTAAAAYFASKPCAAMIRNLQDDPCIKSCGRRAQVTPEMLDFSDEFAKLHPEESSAGTIDPDSDIEVI